VDLFRDVMDKGIVDHQGDKMGRVDDLLLELRPGELPAVRTIVLDHGAILPLLPAFIAHFLAWFEKAVLRVARLAPVEISWDDVSSIDVVVHTTVDRRAVGAVATEEALWVNWVSKLPWARR